MENHNYKNFTEKLKYIIPNNEFVNEKKIINYVLLLV